MTASMRARWVEALDESQELTYGETFGVTHGWWLDRRSFGLGVSVSREVGSNTWPNRVSVLVEVGPLSWGAAREWRSS